MSRVVWFSKRSFCHITAFPIFPIFTCFITAFPIFPIFMCFITAFPIFPMFACFITAFPTLRHMRVFDWVMLLGVRNVQALLLLAPFTGVQEIAGSIVGDTLAGIFNLNQWNNRVSWCSRSRLLEARGVGAGRSGAGRWLEGGEGILVSSMAVAVRSRTSIRQSLPFNAGAEHVFSPTRQTRLACTDERSGA